MIPPSMPQIFCWFPRKSHVSELVPLSCKEPFLAFLEDKMVFRSRTFFLP